MKSSHLATRTHALARRRRRLATRTLLPVIALTVAGLVVALASNAQAAATSIGLGNAESFAVLAGSTVTNTGLSVISGDVGVSPGSAVTGFPPGLVTGGTIHAADALAGQAKADLANAYDVAAGEPTSETISADLGGRTLTTGVYTSATSLGLTGDLTLDAQGDSSAVFVFQAGSTLTTASGSHVLFTNGASPCNVFWQIGSSATLGSGSTFIGTILALTSISVDEGATIQGRLLARNGAVTLINDTVTRPTCSGSTAGGSTTGTTTGGTTGSTTGTTTGGTTGSTTGTTGGTTGSTTGTPGLTGGSTTGGSTIDTPGLTGGSTIGTTGGTDQVTAVPTGSAETGDGGSITGRGLWATSGFLALLVSGGALVWWRREPFRS